MITGEMPKIGALSLLWLFFIFALLICYSCPLLIYIYCVFFCRGRDEPDRPHQRLLRRRHQRQQPLLRLLPPPPRRRRRHLSHGATMKRTSSAEPPSRPLPSPLLLPLLSHGWHPHPHPRCCSDYETVAVHIVAAAAVAAAAAAAAKEDRGMAAAGWCWEEGESPLFMGPFCHNTPPTPSPLTPIVPSRRRRS